MQKINIIISICLISMMCVMFTACDYSKKYTKLEINALYNEIVADEELKTIFNNENKNLSISWSEKVNQGFISNSPELDNIENLFLPNIEMSFDIFNELNAEITDEWNKDDTTKIYLALKDTKNIFYNFTAHKKSLEDSLKNSSNINALDSIQKNYYDNLVSTMIELNDKILVLSKNTVDAYIANECPDFYSSENTAMESNKDFIGLSNLMRLELIKLAYDFDVNTSYCAYEARKTLFNLSITEKIKIINALYKDKKYVIYADNISFSDNIKSQIIDLRLLQKQIKNNIKIYEKALTSYDSFEMYKHRDDLSAYFASLKKDKQTDHKFVQDFNNYYFGYMSSKFEKILNSI